MSQAADGPAGVGSTPPLLRIEKLNKSFGKLVHVLRDLDLDMNADERLVIIGPSGGGKSTLLRCVMGLEDIDSGTIFFEGEPYIDTRPGERHARTVIDKRIRLDIGMVFQHYTLFPHLTVMENLTLAPVRVRKESKSQAVERGRALLDRLNLMGKADEFPNRLSGGQKQRAAIARALMLEPKLMLFDEITSALDPELVVEVLNVMLKLAEQDMAMMVITHEMDFAKKIATRVAFIDEGRVLEQGPPEIIFSEPVEARTRDFLNHFIVGA